MTYSIRLTVNAGAVTLTSAGGIPPAGAFIIEGSDDGNRLHLAVHQHDAEGKFVTSASHTLDRAEQALHDAEETAEAVTEAGGQAVVGVAVAGAIDPAEGM